MGYSDTVTVNSKSVPHGHHNGSVWPHGFIYLFKVQPTKRNSNPLSVMLKLHHTPKLLLLTSLKSFPSTSKINTTFSTSNTTTKSPDSWIIYNISLSVQDHKCMPSLHVFSITHAHYITDRHQMLCCTLQLCMHAYKEDNVIKYTMVHVTSHVTNPITYRLHTANNLITNK